MHTFLRYKAPDNIAEIVQEIVAHLDHARFQEHFDCARHHGDPVFTLLNPHEKRTLQVAEYRTDPRCPDIVVWLVTANGLHSPGVRRDWTLDRVRAEFAGSA